MPAPDAFGLVWEDQGPKRTMHGLRNLWHAPETPEFDKAYWAAKSLLRGIGYGYDRYASHTVCFWERADLDWSTVPGVIEQAEAAAAAAEIEREERRKEEEARRAAWLAEQERKRAEAEARRVAEAAEILESLQWVVEHRYWTIHHSAAQRAEELAALDVLPVEVAGEAHSILRRSVDTARRARERVDAHVPTPSDASLAADPRLRRLALIGIEHITLRDLDRAAVLNGVGWSRSTTGAGHVLAEIAAEKGDLSQAQAAQAIALLRRHAGQLPPDIQAALFGRVVRHRATAQAA